MLDGPWLCHTRTPWVQPAQVRLLPRDARLLARRLPSACQPLAPVSAARPAAANTAKYVRDGGKLAAVVQTPEDANPGARVNVISVLTHDDPAQLQGIADAAGRGDLSIPIAARFKLSQLGQAHKALAGNPHGKILLVR